MVIYRNVLRMNVRCDSVFLYFVFCNFVCTALCYCTVLQNSTRALGECRPRRIRSRSGVWTPDSDDFPNLTDTSLSRYTFE